MNPARRKGVDVSKIEVDEGNIVSLIRAICSRNFGPSFGPARAALLMSVACCVSIAQQTPVAPPAAPSVQRPATPTEGTTAKPADRPAAAGSGVGEPVNSSSYKIGPADVLNINVWDEARFSGPAVVHQDGMITMPLIGDLKAGDMTPVQVEEEVGTALKKYVTKPLVTVTVQQVGSKRYYMDGLINKPGEYPLVVPVTILESISKAGGIQPFANSKKIYVLRGSKRIRFNYKDVLRGKNMDQNIELQSNDHVVVP